MEPARKLRCRGFYCGSICLPKYCRYPDSSYEIVSLLIDAGCGLDSITGWSLVPSGYCINQTALFKAIEVGNKKIVKTLIQHGAKVNKEAAYTVRRTPLQKAAEIRSLDIVRLPLKHDADVNAQPSFFFSGTALQFATISGNCIITAELLGHGALLYMSPSQVGGGFPLEGAAEHGRLDMIEFLWRARKGIAIFEDIEGCFQKENMPPLCT